MYVLIRTASVLTLGPIQCFEQNYEEIIDV